MTMLRTLMLGLFLSLTTLTGHAASPAAPIELSVDARDTDHRLFRVRETIPAQPGTLRLQFPRWLPGKHRPDGEIDKLAGLRFSANGVALSWKRDPYDVYSFVIEVPETATAVIAEFEFLSALSSRQGRVVITADLLNLQWNQVILAPAGLRADELSVRADVLLPSQWAYATALKTEARDGDHVRFAPISYEHLVDSPMFAGRHFRQLALDANSKQPVYLNLFADDARYLEVSEAQLAPHRALLTQADRLYGVRHFDRYDFLLALTDKLGGIGLEHHRSSENTRVPGYFTEWDAKWAERGLLPHEYNHSWNGKYRRGDDMAVARFDQPMGDSLLWLYEGQTQFYGYVLTARSGLWTPEQARDMLALVAAVYDRGRPGLAWRPLQDTTNDPTIAARRPLSYRNYQLSEDYYNGGQLVWLEVNAKLMELTAGKRSLDDFARAFFGGAPTTLSVKTYDFDEIVRTLNSVAAYDWASLLRSRLDGHGPLTHGLEASGWRLRYVDKPSAGFTATEAAAKRVDLSYSLGLVLDDKHVVVDVIWDGPAFNAGIAPGMTVVAVNGREISAERLRLAVTAARNAPAPIELLVKDEDRFVSRSIDYHGGLQYPVLERIEGRKDLLEALYRPR